MAEAATMDVEEHITKVPVPDPKLVGYVIGKGGRTIYRLMKGTSTYIQYEKDTNEFSIEGEADNRYAAKLKVKEIFSNGLKTQTENYKTCWRFPFVDSNGSIFVLAPVDLSYSAFKVVMKDSFNTDPSQSTDYSSFSSQMVNVLQSIHDEKNDDVINNIWSHFGHIYLSNVNYDETAAEFDGQELLSHVKWDNTSNATQWRTKFVGGIVDGFEPHNLNAWMATRTEKGSPFIRYECVYFTPSCRVIRVKIFLAIDVINNKVTYRNIPKCEPVANIIKSSDTEPYFYLCGSTVKRAMVDIFQPAEELDFRFIVDSGSKVQAEVDDKEVDALFNFIRDNMTVKHNSGLELLQENLPRDFDLCYARVSERRTYPFTSEEDEQFTVKLSYEHIVNRPTSTAETTIDIHLQYDDWDRMLEDGTWTPHNIVDKIPQFMKCAGILARILKAPGTTPIEILARGPKAQEAYDTALQSGKTKYCRVPVVLVGQSGAGKTSLLRSLRREKFNPEEDSTDGVRLHRSFSKAEADIWHEDETFESSLVDCTARVVAENLSSSFNGDRKLTPAQEDDNEEPLNQDPVQEVDEKEVGSPVEENNKNLDAEDRRIENEREIAVTEESVDVNAIPPCDPVLFQGSTKDNPIPEEVSERATNILQNPEELEIQDCVHLVTLDFAGQPVYNATHPVFLPKKPIFLLVNSLESEIHAKATPMVKHGSSSRKVDDHCPMTNVDHLESWLSFVASLWTMERVSIIDDNVLQLVQKGNKASNREQKSPTKEAKLPRRLPPVFLVCTHADIPFKGNNAEEMTRKIFSYLKHDNDAPGRNHIVRGIYAVNNTVSGGSESEEESVENLRAHIYQLARSLPYVNDVIPLRWLHFEKKLSDLATNENKTYLWLEEAMNVAAQCQIAVNTEEFKTVLNYLHDLKVIIHFEDTKIVIIDIQWLLDMIVKVITVQPAEDWEDEYEEQWKRLENDGILERALIDHVWENETTARSLLMIMEKFSLLCRWKRPGDPDIFLVPSMLMNSDAKSADELLSDQKTSRTLVVSFKSVHLPLGIFPRLLVVIAKTCNEKWPDSPQPKFYHNFCRFYDVGGVGDSGKSFDLVVTSDIKTISFSVINEQGITGLPLEQLCRFIVDFLSKTLNVIRSSFPWMKNVEYEFCIRCPQCYSSSEPCKLHSVSRCTRDACLHFITEEKLRNKQARCYRNHTSKNTFFEEENYCDWFDISRHAHEDDQETVQVELQPRPIDVLPGISGLGNNENDNHPSRMTSSSEAASSKDLEIIFGDKSIATIDPKEAASKVADLLKLDKLSLDDPPDDIVMKCRELCSYLKSNRRGDIVEKIRDLLPSGMTGPLGDGSLLVKYMDFNSKQRISRALSAKDQWKAFAEKVGVSKDDIAYYDHRVENPVLSILNDHCGDLTVEELYVHIVESGLNTIADNHL